MVAPSRFVMQYLLATLTSPHHFLLVDNITFRHHGCAQPMIYPIIFNLFHQTVLKNQWPQQGQGMPKPSCPYLWLQCIHQLVTCNQILAIRSLKTFSGNDCYKYVLQMSSQKIWSHQFMDLILILEEDITL